MVAAVVDIAPGDPYRHIASPSTRCSPSIRTRVCMRKTDMCRRGLLRVGWTSMVRGYRRRLSIGRRVIGLLLFAISSPLHRRLLIGVRRLCCRRRPAVRSRRSVGSLWSRRRIRRQIRVRCWRPLLGRMLVVIGPPSHGESSGQERSGWRVSSCSAF